MFNHIVLIGRLCADPELRYTQSGTPVASFTLAVDRAHKSQAGERETDFIAVVVWQKLAEVVAQHLKKGRLAAVQGRLHIRSYENREGQKVRVAEVVATEVQFLDKSPGTGGDTAGSGESPVPSAPMRYRDDPFAGDAFSGDIDDSDLPF